MRVWPRFFKRKRRCAVGFTRSWLTLIYPATWLAQVCFTDWMIQLNGIPTSGRFQWKKLHQYLWRYVPEWRAKRLIDSPSYLILWTEAAGSRLDLRTVVHGSTIPPPSQHLSGWSWCIFRHASAASALWLSEVTACGNVAFFMLPHLPKPKQCLPNTDMLQSPHWPASLRLPRLASPRPALRRGPLLFFHSGSS